LDVCSNRGAKREMGGASISNGGAGTTGPPAGDGSASSTPEYPNYGWRANSSREAIFSLMEK